jgi:hypothetical protein
MQLQMHVDDGAKIQKQINMPSKKKRALNGFEMHMISEALKMYQEEQCKGIRDIIKGGNNPIMTEGFIIMEVEQLKDKLKDL